MNLFNDKTVFVTGGAHGIGRSIVEAFREAGARVAFCDIDRTNGTAAASATGALFLESDVSDVATLERALEQAYAQFGDLDILVNNAGISRFSPLTESTIEEFDRIIATDLRSVFVTSRCMAQHRNTPQNRTRYGRIINIASTRWTQSEPGSEAYAASKGGIVSLTHALAISLSEYNITVNCISPGWIDTGHFGTLSARDHRQHPSGRVGTPQDIARACLFLADPNNDFINGENLVIDGGMTRKMIYEE